MSPRPRLLFLSHCLPYPPHSGVTIRTFNVLRQLLREFDVTLLMFSRRNHQPDGASREAGWRALRETGLDPHEAAPIGSDYSSARTIWDHLRSVATRRAYTFYQYQSTAFRRQLHEVLSRTSFNLIHMDAIDLHGTLDDLPAVPVVCTHHDIESHALRRRAAHAQPAALRPYIRYQAALVERTERSLCPAFAANLVMSDIDRQRLLELAPAATVEIAPNGVDTTFFVPSGNGRPSGQIVFAGHTFVEANRDAVDFFLGDIWPLVRARRQSSSVHLIGRSSEADRVRFCGHDGVIAHGYVPDIRPHLAEADCAVVPIRFGGGTRIKILDAWAMGRAVVSTSVGCEGLRAVDGENILVRDAPESFASAVAEVLADPELRGRLGRAGRSTVEEFYSWDIVGSRMRQLYSTLALRP